MNADIGASFWES
jgi:hypothetical protein